MTKVLVNGGAGFIGSHLCEGLIARGLQVRVLDNLSYGRREWVPPDVEFLGYVSERQKLELLGSAWLLLQTAMHEGWGLVITEAGSLGTPSLGFDVPGVRDAIVDGTTGLLVQSEEEFGVRWAQLAADRDELARLGRSDIMVVVGGVIPPEDLQTLRAFGVAQVFTPGTVIPEAAILLLEGLNERLGYAQEVSGP